MNDTIAAPELRVADLVPCGIPNRYMVQPLDSKHVTIFDTFIGRPSAFAVATHSGDLVCATHNRGYRRWIEWCQQFDPSFRWRQPV